MPRENKSCPQTMGCWFPHELAVAPFDGHKTSEIVLWVSYGEITVGTHYLRINGSFPLTLEKGPIEHYVLWVAERSATSP